MVEEERKQKKTKIKIEESCRRCCCRLSSFGVNFVFDF